MFVLKKLSFIILMISLVNYQPISCSLWVNFINGFLNTFGLGAQVYKLTYFNFTGRAEFIRWIFIATNQSFEDIRINPSDWPTLKDTFVFGQLPVLDVIEKSRNYTIAQSGAIARFLASRFNLAGKNDVEAAHANMYSDQLTDLFNKLPEPSYNNTLTSSLFKSYLKPFEDRLRKNNGFLAGSRLSYADLYLSSILDNLLDLKNDTLKEFPCVSSLDFKIRQMQRIKDYLNSRL